MLVIDKSETSTRLIVTLSEVNPIVTGSTLELFNQSTNVTSQFYLPDDTSLFPERYNQFEFETSFFSGCPIGSYVYTVRDSSGATTETGLLKVVGDVMTPQQQVDEDFVFITNDETQDDFIVYQA